MIAKPTTSNYEPSSFLSRAIIKIGCQTESDWVKFLDKKFSTSIQWDCYWWKCPPPLLRSLGSDHIFLVGLRRATFYKGDRLLRQFKYEQGMPGGKRRRFFTLVDTNLLLYKTCYWDWRWLTEWTNLLSRFTFTRCLQNTLTGW